MTFRDQCHRRVSDDPAPAAPSASGQSRQDRDHLVADGVQTRAPRWQLYLPRQSKAAALNLGRNLATDLKPEGIAVGIYHPGWVRTDMGGTVPRISAMDESAAGLMARFDGAVAEHHRLFRDLGRARTPLLTDLPFAGPRRIKGSAR